MVLRVQKMSAKNRKSAAAIESILSSMKGSYSTDKILKEFRKPKDKIDHKLCQAILRNLAKSNPSAKKSYEEISNNFDQNEPYECLEKFLIGFYKVTASKPSQETTSRLAVRSPEMLQTNPPKSNQSPLTPVDTLSPQLCSTKLNDDPAVVLPTLNLVDIKNRVVKAAIDGVSKYAQNSVVDPPQAPSIFHDTNVKKNFWILDDADLAIVECSSKTISVVATPLIDQERILLKEILHCLIGVPGTFIKSECQRANGEPLPTTVFNVSAEINVSLREMANNILPLANHHSQVQQFISIIMASDSGQTLQALTSTLRTLTYDYLNTLVKLENDSDNLSLNRLYHCLRPSMRTMALLAEIANDIVRSESTGAKVLTILCDKVLLLTGDELGQQIVVDLVEAAAVPYFVTLERWILKGSNENAVHQAERFISLSCVSFQVSSSIHSKSL